jgi:hypothetical protein
MFSSVRRPGRRALPSALSVNHHASMDATLQVDSAGESHCIAHTHAVQIQLWRGTIELEHAQRARDAAARLPDEGRRGLLIVAEAGSSPPGGRARAILTELGTNLEGARACAFVSEGTGLAADTARGVMTAMAFIARPPFPVKVFADVGAAIRWLAETSGVVTVDALEAAVAEMRNIRSA